MKFLLLLLASAIPLSAKIGETKDQLITRYGHPDTEDEDGMLFTRNGMHVKVALLDGKCQWVKFSKYAAPGGVAPPMPPAQLSAIFTANQDGLEWKQADDGTFRSADGRRQAFVANGTLIIQTAAFKAAAMTSGKEGMIEQTRAPVRMAGVPPTRVGIAAKTASAGSGRDKKWETWWGSYDKEIFNDRVVSITLRASTGGTAIVETHWIGEEIEKNSGNKVVEVTREPVSIPDGYPVSIEMGCLFVENDTKFAALGIRERRGIRYAGWVVRVVDGNGAVLAVEGSRPPLIALVK